ncbi:MAG: ISAzo13 family transposase [Gammaproteobacteria bacterium]
MSEKLRRLWAGAEAQAMGRGGIAAVSQATGLSRATISSGVRELKQGGTRSAPEMRVRRKGGGRKALTESDPAVLTDLEALVEPSTRGDPQSALRWTCKSTTKLAEELGRRGHRISPRTVAELLHELEYSLQANRKTREGSSHPDRNAQFEHINRQIQAFQQRGEPVVSVDTKKKELVGDFKNGGREWQPKGSPEPVRVHDFIDKKLGKAIPYGVYDVAGNRGWVSVGTDHDTAEFAIETIHRWWRHMGLPAYPKAKELLILADGGGSNSSRTRLWKVALQRLADQTGIVVSVCHFPPGTSKWNKIEHRMFSHITENWRGRPLISHEVVVNLIGDTTTKQGLKIQAQLDPGVYQTGIQITDDEMARVHLELDSFHGDWNYRVLPAKTD